MLHPATLSVNLINNTHDALKTVYLAAKRCTSGGTAFDEECSAPTPRDTMSRLVKRVLASGHTSVLEHVTYTFHVYGLSRVASHQLVRHRLASYSQQSQRYAQAASTVVFPESLAAHGDAFSNIVDRAHELYLDLIARGVPEEDARYVLPQGITTSIILTMNARELRETFFPLRMCRRAQWEIRHLAEAMHAACLEADPELFEGTGPSCVLLGYCPEGSRSCGRAKTLAEVGRV